MNFRPETITVLSAFDVDPERGFLPSTDPLLKFPNQFSAWEQLSSDFSALINAGVIHHYLEDMDCVENVNYQTYAEAERGMLLLSMFAHAYVNLPGQKKSYLPPSIAIPWIKTADCLGRVPVLTHASLALQNWKRINPEYPIQVNNLATLMQFHGGLDESWFYLITTNIEAAGGPVISLLLEAHAACSQDNYEKAIGLLEKSLIHLDAMNDLLMRMYEHCDPSVFYHRIRPFLDSFNQIEYQGTNQGKLNFHGGSAAQSSLIQCLDAFLGMEYSAVPSTDHYLKAMRKYMPPKHAAFLEKVEKEYSLKQFLNQHKNFDQVFQEILHRLIKFRNEHLKMVSIYIVKQAKAAQEDAVGTGGTNPLKFLKTIRNRNQEK